MAYIMTYSVIRLCTIIAYLYLELSGVPEEVLYVSAGVCILAIGIAVATYANRLSGKKLRLCLLLYALGTIVNFFICSFSVLGELNIMDLFVIGTFFDIFMFILFCFVKIRNMGRPFMVKKSLDKH